MNILEETINEVLDEASRKEADYQMLLDGWRRIDEASLNRIMEHGKHGFLIVSSQRSGLETYDKNPSLSLSKEFEEWANANNAAKDEESANAFLKKRNADAEKYLNSSIKESGYAYSPVNGGYHYKGDPGNTGDTYEISYIVYNHKRNGTEDYADFDILFKLGLEWCKELKQESIYVQFPDAAPHYYNAEGEVCDSHSSKNFKFNRDGEEYFTTTKRKSSNPQKFTADIRFENLYRRGLSERMERMRRTQSGEVVFDDIDLKKQRKTVDETSRRQKAVQAVQGRNRKVKTIGIISAQNPMGQKASKEYNDSSHEDLLRNLKIGHYQYFVTDGKYGDPETSVMVYNISLEEMINLCYRYNQESMIFIDMTDGNEVSCQYWEGADKTSKLEKAREVHKFINAENDDDFYTKVGREFKFRIPFFENIRKVVGTIERNASKYDVDSLVNECISDKYVGSHKYFCRCKLYGTGDI